MILAFTSILNTIIIKFYYLMTNKFAKTFKTHLIVYLRWKSGPLYSSFHNFRAEHHHEAWRDEVCHIELCSLSSKGLVDTIKVLFTPAEDDKANQEELSMKTKSTKSEAHVLNCMQSSAHFQVLRWTSKKVTASFILDELYQLRNCPLF